MVSTDSSFDSKTVFESFKDMSLGSEPVEIDFVKDWVSEWMPNGLVPDLEEKFPWFYYYDRSKKQFKSPNLSDVETILGVLKEHKDNLIKMLVLLDYTWDVAEKTVSCIVEDFQSSLLEFRLLPTTDDDDDDCLEVVVYDVSHLGRYLSSALCNRLHCALVLFSDDILIPFYCFFVQKCYENSIPNIINLEFIRNEVKGIQIPCPMIIFEDADIASAISSFCKSVCEFKTTSSDVVSHLFVQESVFESTISLLESTLKRVRHGSRLDKKTQLEFTEPSEEIEISHNLKVFTPCKNSPIKLFVGWNPADTDQSNLLKNSRGHIPSVPFRNFDELGVLLKELLLDNGCFHNSLSVWGEKISHFRSFPNELQFSTLWINSHGLTHPLIPCNLHKYQPFYFVFPSSYDKESLIESVPVATIDTSNIISKSHYSKSFFEALANASKAFKTWHFNKGESKLKFLEPLCKVFTSSRRETQSSSIMPRSKSVNEMIKHVIDTTLTDCLASKAKVMSEYRPVGVVLVCVLTLYKELENDLNRLVSSLLIQGNTVVIVSSQNVLKSLMMTNNLSTKLLRMYESTSCYSLLTFLECTNDINFLQFKIKPARIIYIGHNKNSPFTRDNFLEYFVGKQNNYLHDDDYCLQLSTVSKSTWFL